ncbi:MAG: hypothetical protein JWP00_342 [Chloroflexi bacterium]|nr:hypothetical protein [Chloroflexota bacterium]
MKNPRTGRKYFQCRAKLLYFKDNCWLSVFLLVVISLIGLRITLSETRAASAIWDVNNGSYTNDANCTPALLQCSSIAAAVAAASPGDTITVSAGSSLYAGFSVNTPGLSILGPNAFYNPVTDTRYAEAQLHSVVIVEPGATGVTIQGFEFNRAESWIQVKAGNFTLKNNVFSALNSKAIIVNSAVSNLAIENNLIPVAYQGIEASLISSSRITGNKIGNTSNNIETAISLDAVNDILVSGNHLSRINNQAIVLANTAGTSSNVTISNNYIYRGNSSGVADHGAIQFYGNSASPPNALNITNNIIQGSRSGIVVSTGGNIGGNVTVSNNCFDGTISTFPDLYHGGTGSLAAPNNYSAGIAPSTGGPGPVVVTPYLGIDAITSLSNPSIEGNTPGQSVVLARVKNSAGAGVANQIVSYKFVTQAGTNPIEGLMTSDASGNLALTLGQAVPVGTYDLVLNPDANVSFPVNRQGCHAHINISLKVTPACTVNDASASAGYSSIASALAGSCPAIRVTGGGPYREALVINRPVILKGPNAGKNPNTEARGSEVNIFLGDGFNDYTGINNNGTVIKILSSNVVIDGFTLDGNNPFTDGGVLINGEDVNAAYGLTNYTPSGIPFAFSNVTVENNIIKNFNLGAIRWTGISSAVSGNYIRNNRLDNVFPTGDDGYGVYLGDNFYTEITGNEMLRVRNGIRLKGFDAANPGLTAAIKDNNIDSFRAGISLDSSGGFTIANNVLKSTLTGNSNIGLWLSNIQASPGVTVSNNSITGGDTGIKAWGVASLTVSGGSVTGANYGVYLYNYQAGPAPNTPGVNTALTLSGISVTNSVLAGLYLNDSAPDPSNELSLVIQTGSSITGGARGIAVFGQDTTLQLNDTAFRGQSGDYITLESGGDGLPGKVLDARSAKFEGATGVNLTNDQYAAVQAKLTDKNDAPGLGLIILYNPALAVSNLSLTYSDILGGSNPPAQSFSISNTAQASLSLDWSLEAPVYGAGATGWFSCGATTGGTLEPGASTAPISCQATTGNLSGGSYTATLSITSGTSGVQGSPQVIAVTFVVIAPPVITTGPASQTIVGQQAVTLTVAASSLAPMTYQWYEGSDRAASTAVGTDSASFTSPVLTGPTTYWVKVINSAGSVESALANISLCSPLVVVSGTDNGTGADCGTFSYALKAAGLSSQAVTITFAAGVTSVTLNGPLAPVANTGQVAITIDGGCTGTNTPGTKILAGTNSSAIGLRLTGKITVKCLVVAGFSEYALSLEGNDNTLLSSWLGTLNGISGSGAGGGVSIAGSNNKLGAADSPASGSRIFGNNNAGVLVSSGQANMAYNNSIYLEKNPTLPLPARLNAVYISAGGQLKFEAGNRISIRTVQG